MEAAVQVYGKVVETGGASDVAWRIVPVKSIS